MAIKITPEEYQKKFGTQALQTALKPPEQKPGIFSQAVGGLYKYGKNLVEDYKGIVRNQIDETSSAVNKIGVNPLQNDPRENIKTLASTGLRTASNAVSAIFAPIGEAIKPGINAIAESVSNDTSGQFQKFANSKVGDKLVQAQEGYNKFSQTETGKNINAGINVAGAVVGEKPADELFARSTQAVKNIPGEVVSTTKNAVNKVGEVAQPVKSAVRDVVPTMDQSINHQVTSALDLTASDVKNIHLSTGNEVGRFMADNQLIGQNVKESMKLVDDFFQKNYTTVRSKINEVKTEYKPSQIPRYTEALKAIEKKIERVPGMQEAEVEVAQLLDKKGNITLNDVQRVKELVDDHFSIYGRTGDVGEAVAKQGLDNIRKELKVFIENEVKKNTGTDIGQLNNNVSTAKGIMKSVEARSTSGLTRSNIQRGDFGAFGVGTAVSFPVLGPLAPLGGIAAVFVKKVLEAPSIQLRIAKLLDGISDAKKAQIKATLEAGKIPPELEQFIRKKN